MTNPFTLDHQIMSHLLAYEGRESVNPTNVVTDEEPEYSSSSDDNSVREFVGVEEDSSEAEEFIVRVSQDEYRYV